MTEDNKNYQTMLVENDHKYNIIVHKDAINPHLDIKNIVGNPDVKHALEGLAATQFAPIPNDSPPDLDKLVKVITLYFSPWVKGRGAVWDELTGGIEPSAESVLRFIRTKLMNNNRIG